MEKSNLKTWQEQWKVLDDDLGKGGQGLTKKVQQNTDGKEGTLKVLRRPKDMQSRKRLWSEISALKILEHTNIPVILDSNVEYYSDKSIELYAVFSYIDGRTLFEELNNKHLELESALGLTTRLLDIVSYIHSENIVHRDIKPQNIIIQQRHWFEPILIDFGISFREDDESHHTKDGEDIVNRFLFLPELAAGSDNKRDPRSDLTYCIAILFYCLTGINPGRLFDQNNLQPHQRKNAVMALQKLPSSKLKILHDIFQTGFQNHIDQRFQTVKAITARLESLNKQDDNEQIKAVSPYEELKSKLEAQSGHMQRIEEARVLEVTIARVIESVEAVRFPLGQHFETRRNYLLKPELETRTCEIGISFIIRSTGAVVLTTRVLAKLVGTELVLEATTDPDNTELVRVPYWKFNDWEKIREPAQNYFLRKLNETIA